MNNHINELQKKMYEDGLKVEDYFIELAERDGYKCLKSNNFQDKYEHWDIKIIKDKKSARVDVKGYKESHKTGFTWVEFQNINGDKGWINGKAHVIAFEREDRFDLIDRVKLKKFIKSKIVNPTGYVYIKPDDLLEIAYHRYRRMGRRDIIILVPFDDIEQFIMTTIYK
jgi:hypothetical protein